MDDFVTPADLSRELGVDQRRIREYLREKHGRLPLHEQRWLLNGERASDARRHFQK